MPLPSTTSSIAACIAGVTTTNAAGTETVPLRRLKEVVGPAVVDAVRGVGGEEDAVAGALDAVVPAVGAVVTAVDDGTDPSVIVEIGVHAVTSSLMSAACDLPAGSAAAVPEVAGVKVAVPAVGLPTCLPVPPLPLPDLDPDALLSVIPVSNRSMVARPLVTVVCASLTAATRAAVSIAGEPFPVPVVVGAAVVVGALVRDAAPAEEPDEPPEPEPDEPEEPDDPDEPPEPEPDEPDEPEPDEPEDPEPDDEPEPLAELALWDALVVVAAVVVVAVVLTSVWLARSVASACWSVASVWFASVIAAVRSLGSIVAITWPALTF